MFAEPRGGTVSPDPFSAPVSFSARAMLSLRPRPTEATQAWLREAVASLRSLCVAHRTTGQHTACATEALIGRRARTKCPRIRKKPPEKRKEKKKRRNYIQSRWRGWSSRVLRAMRADTAPVTLTGVVRKRRSLSRLLAFIDLETDDTSTVALVADGWFLLKTIVAGLRVRVTGVWETPCETRGARLALVTDGVTVLEDVRSENAWENASASAAWRARVRETGASADTTVRRSADRRRDVPHHVPVLVGFRSVP